MTDRPTGVSSMILLIKAFGFFLGFRVPLARDAAASTATASSDEESTSWSTRPIFNAFFGRMFFPAARGTIFTTAPCRVDWG